MDSWTDIVQVSAGELPTLGVKANGTVGGAGSQLLRPARRGLVDRYRPGELRYYLTVGLKADGTVVGVGYNNYGSSRGFVDRYRPGERWCVSTPWA